jgi:hypothetical protein
MAGIQYTVFAREDLAFTFGVIGRAAEASSVGYSVQALDTAYVTMPIGVRWNPFTAKHPESQLKPFVGATIGPAFGGTSIVRVANEASVDFGGTTAAGDLFGGVDFHIARAFSVTVTGGYTWAGLHNNGGGPEFTIGFGFPFGKGR